MNWLTDNWLSYTDRPWISAVLIAIAVLCGAMVGFEREKRLKPAGLRTMILICVGAAAFTMASRTLAGAQGEVSRVAAQIVTGIGFIGAGAIIQSGAAVRGLTTAATVWVVAATGMIIGAGFGGAGLLLASTIVVVLGGAAMVEKRYLGPCAYRQIRVVYEPDHGKSIIQIDAVLDEYEIPAEARSRRIRADGMDERILIYCNAHKHHKDFLVRLVKLPMITEIHTDGAPHDAPT